MFIGVVLWTEEYSNIPSTGEFQDRGKIRSNESIRPNRFWIVVEEDEDRDSSILEVFRRNRRE